jgi:hypothetical protein
LENFLHSDLKVFELVVSDGFVVFKAHGVKFQQFAEVVLDGLISQFYLYFALEQKTCVVAREL